ncbi:MAG: hypothetical protein ACOX6T_21225 [Myxococcales bacterium]
MRTFLLSTLGLTLMLAAVPARGEDGDLPRRRPRLTDPSEFEEVDFGRSKRSRKHARPIEESAEEESWRSESEAPADRSSKDRRRSSSWEPSDAEEEPRRAREDDPFASEPPAGDEAPLGRELPPADPASSRSDDFDLRDDRASGSRSRERFDDDSEWRDDSLRHVRTAEEELRSDRDRPRRLSGLDEPGYGLAAEVTLGGLLIDDAAGGFRGRFAFGLNFAWQAGRLFAPEDKLLHKGLFVEASYLYPLASKAGTDAVRVESGQHNLALAAAFGLPFKLAHVYAKVGPALFIQPVSYDVQGTLTGWTGVKGGVLYGIGARKVHYFNRELGIAGRVEITGIRRHYLNDLQLSASCGVAF